MCSLRYMDTMLSVLLLTSLLTGLATSVLLNDPHCSQCECCDCSSSIHTCQADFRPRLHAVFCCHYTDNLPGDKHLYVELEVKNCSTQRSWIRSPKPAICSESTENCTGYSLNHEHSCLTRMPENLCCYQDIRYLELHGNKMAQFPDLLPDQTKISESGCQPADRDPKGCFQRLRRVHCRGNCR